ncbi:MAG TPA: sporulation protein [Betaproteobacteria bacterium]|nr:sporulation protein [Betaproteobacteria bacterium]
MARNTRTRPVERKKAGSLFSGIMIGVIVGLAVAAGVALWVDRSNPFKTRDTTSVTPPSSKSAKPAPVAPNAAPPATDSEKPRFDFYKILPGNETPMTEQDLHQRPTPAAGEQYFLQAGAFPNSADADNLKARLALLGFEAAIQTAELPGKGLWHRVRLGPYTSLDELNKVRAALVQNEIKAQLVKVKNPAPDSQSNDTQ